MEMHQVRYAVALARTLNFTRAAEACNVSQPSLTRAIQKLEDEFGGPLFLREHSLTNLTELGRAMLPHLERTLQSAEDAKAEALAFRRQDTAPLNLGVEHGVSIAPIAAAISELGRSLRGFSLTVVDSERASLVDRLLQGVLEVALIERANQLPDRFDCWIMAREGFVALMRSDHPLSKLNRVTVEDLQKEPLILQKSSLQFQVGDLESARPTDLPLRHVCTDLGQVKELARAGLGIAIISSSFQASPDLIARPIENLEPVRDIILTSVCGRRHSLAVAGLIRLVRSRGFAAQIQQNLDDI
jgi:DNA-binding transcriptional LysR family regulator